jgi:putative salt-induced outer membrane protein YdiY
MRSFRLHVSVATTLFLLTVSGTLHAQTPPAAPPPAAPSAPVKPWAGSAGFGLSLNRGNTTTSNLNVSAEATHDPKTASVWKFKGLYLRGETNGTLAVDRLNLDGRNEHTFSPRAYGFGEAQFLEDEFKQIDYLFAPSAGVGYKIVATPRTSLNADGGLGVKFEKDAGYARRTDPVVTAADKLEHKLSTTASLTQSFGALWKAQDFGDALYTLTGGVAAAITARTQLKIELLDTYATRSPNPALKNNDAALLTTLVYKF